MSLGYSIEQLALRNGHDKPEIWCAYKGVIYDVSKSKTVAERQTL